ALRLTPDKIVRVDDAMRSGCGRLVRHRLAPHTRCIDKDIHGMPARGEQRHEFGRSAGNTAPLRRPWRPPRKSHGAIIGAGSVRGQTGDRPLWRFSNVVWPRSDPAPTPRAPRVYFADADRRPDR